MKIEERLLNLERLIISSMKDVLNTEECAVYLGLSVGRVRHLMSERQIPYYKYNGKAYFNKSEINKCLLQDRIETNEEIKSETNKML